jgi:bla regulator protein blaR1
VIVPALRAGLGVEVDNDTAMAEGLGRASKVESEGRLACPALLGNDRNCFHVSMLLLCLDHMLVEALFWFHPLVWWIGSRMVEERELACDEEVLRMGCEPTDYVEGILKVCRFYTESPLLCVSGVTGADVKKRLRAILAGKVAHKLSLGRKAVLAALGLAALVAPVAVGILDAPAIRAQTPAAKPPEFEAASIKLIPCAGSRCGGGAGMERLQFTPIRVSSRPVEGISARGIILEAYHLRFDQLSGGPSWLDSDRFELEAVTATPTDTDQMRRMLQNLLAERFKLVVHRETKEMPVYFLTVGKKGAKLRERKDDDDVPDPSPGWRGIFIVSTMEQFIANIRNFGHFDRPVLDKTGLGGVYYFVLNPQDLDDDVKSAVEDTFGLKFEPHNAPVDVFTIDNVEKPSAN